MDLQDGHRWIRINAIPETERETRSDGEESERD